MQQAGYHHANLLATQLREDMEAHNHDLMTVLQTALDAQSQALTATGTEISDLTRNTHQANTTTTDKVQLEILQLLKQLQTDMRTGTPTPAPAHKAPRKRRGKKTPDDASFPRRKTDKYCWTHGACAHDGLGCEDK